MATAFAARWWVQVEDIREALGCEREAARCRAPSRFQTRVAACGFATAAWTSGSRTVQRYLQLIGQLKGHRRFFLCSPSFRCKLEMASLISEFELHPISNLEGSAA
jgi:hypothetical protein